MFLLLPLLLSLLPLGSYAHTESHYSYADIQNFLNTSIVQISSTPSEDSVEIVFPKDNQTFYVSKKAIEKSLLETTKALQKMQAQDHNHGSVINPLNWPKLVSDFVKSLPNKMVIAKSAIGSMAQEYGYLPVVVIVTTVAVTYPVYTFATEIVESMFLGPAHVFCQFFQVLYFAAIKQILNQVDRIYRWADYAKESFRSEISFFVISKTSEKMRKNPEDPRNQMHQLLSHWETLLKEWYQEEQISKKDFQELHRKVSYLRIANKPKTVHFCRALF